MAIRVILPDRLFQSSITDARGIVQVLDRGVEVVVDLAAEELPVAYPRTIPYVRLPIVDGWGNHDWLLRLAIKTVASLIESRIPTLVFCSAGLSRSPALVAAALSKVESLSFREALVRIVGDGPCEVSPALLNDLVAVLQSMDQ